MLGERLPLSNPTKHRSCGIFPLYLEAWCLRYTLSNRSYYVLLLDKEAFIRKNDCVSEPRLRPKYVVRTNVDQRAEIFALYIRA